VIDYRGRCPDCFAPVLRLVVIWTGSVVDVEPAVQKRGEGYVRCDLWTGHAYFIPTKVAKKQEHLHLPHFCKTEEEKTEQWQKAAEAARQSSSRRRSSAGRKRASAPTAAAR
jgi:hypothetical protein